jgi:hypothetical protein
LQYAQSFFVGEQVWVLNDEGVAIWSGEVMKVQASGVSWTYLVKHDGGKELWKNQSMLKVAGG